MLFYMALDSPECNYLLICLQTLLAFEASFFFKIHPTLITLKILPGIRVKIFLELFVFFILSAWIFCQIMLITFIFITFSEFLIDFPFTLVIHILTLVKIATLNPTLLFITLTKISLLIAFFSAFSLCFEIDTYCHILIFMCLESVRKV